MKCHCSIVTDMDTLVLWIAFLMCPQITYLSIMDHDLWVMPVFSSGVHSCNGGDTMSLVGCPARISPLGERGVKGCRAPSGWVEGCSGSLR